jgi:hypothetical protein
MQPLFEHRLRVDGYETRALELEGDGPGLVLLRAMVGEVYRQLVFAKPRAAEAAVVASFAAHHASREGVAALLAGVGHCPQLEATERLLELLLPFAVAEAA